MANIAKSQEKVYKRKMETIGKRIIWKKYLYLIIFLALVTAEVFEIIKLLDTPDPDSVLIIMIIATSIAIVVFFVLTLTSFLKNRNAITVEGDDVIIKEYKERVISFREIARLEYVLHGFGKFGDDSYGTLIICLKSNEIIRVADLRKVRTACQQLRSFVFRHQKVTPLGSSIPLENF